MDTWHLLRWKNVTVYSQGSSSSPVGRLRGLEAALLKGARDVQVQLTFRPDTPGMPAEPDHQTQMTCVTVVLDSAGDPTSYASALHVIKMSRGYSVLLVSGDASWNHSWEKVAMPLGFFTLGTTDDGKTFRLQKVMTSRTGRVTTRDVAANHLKAKEDISGAELNMLTLTFVPYVLVPDPEYVGKPLDPKGLLATAMDLISEMANFTYTLSKSPTAHWDTSLPQSSADINTTGGILPSVIMGLNDCPLSLWTATLERKAWVDFSFPVYTTTYSCFANAEFLKFGGGRSLLVTPFTSMSWLLIISLVLFMGSIEGAFTFHRKPSCVATSRLLIFLSGILEVLLLAYYGGALTMFLASFPDAPFNSMYEALTQDEWKLLVANGDETVIENVFDVSKHPRLRRQHNRISSGEFKRSDRSILSVLEELQTKPLRFMAGTRERLLWSKSFHKARLTFRLFEFCEPVPLQGSLVVPKNSPYKSALNFWILRLRDSGILHQLEKDLVGIHPSKLPVIASNQIGFGQVELAFVVGAVALTVVLALLALEMLAKKVHHCTIEN